MSRGVAQDGEATYVGVQPAPVATTLPVLTSIHVALDGNARYVDTSAAQTAAGEVPPTS